MHDADDMGRSMAEMAEMAVADARTEHRTALDFSRRSLRHIDAILETHHRRHVARGLLARLLRRPPTRRDLAGVALMYGAYLGEVLRPDLAGRWVVKEGDPALETDKGWAFPLDKAMKRMCNGEEDDLVFYAEGMVDTLGPTGATG